jgi:hypothetical protein
MYGQIHLNNEEGEREKRLQQGILQTVRYITTYE